MASSNKLVPFKGDGGFIPVGSKKFAIGLLWRTFEEEGVNIDKYARESAKDNGADLYCINRPQNSQIGFGSSQDNHKSGMAVMAYQLAESLDDNFLGIFKIESSYYIIGMSDGKVLSGTDRLIHSQEDVSELFTELFYSQKFPTAIAPSDFALEGTVDRGIEDYISGPSKNKLEKANTSLRKKHIIAGGIVFALLASAYYFYSDYEAKKQAAIDAEQNARMQLISQQARERMMRQQRLFHPPPMPYVGQYNGIQYLLACERAIHNYPKDAAGWTANNITCSDTSIEGHFKRVGGTMNWIGATLNKPNFHPSVNLETNGAKLLSPLNLDGVEKYTKKTTTLPNAEEQIYLFKHFEENFQLIKMAQKTGEPSNVKVGPQNKPETIYTYQYIEFEVKSDVEPSNFINIFGKIPALTITSINLDLLTWTWDIKGRIYEKLPIPPEVEVAPDEDSLPAHKVPGQPGFNPRLNPNYGKVNNSNTNPQVNNRG